MKISATPTPHILVQAATTATTDNCDFAIVEITAFWKDIMKQRFQLTGHLTEDMKFHSLTFLDRPLGFFRCNPDSEIYRLLRTMNMPWKYVTISANEHETFEITDSPLDSHQVIMYDDGTCLYKAYGTYNRGEYFTGSFNFMKIATTENPNNV